ncbi:MAG: hypothetical protein KF824_01895 [Fimbriimonadaceae bacterium]|nr:MAG: hypothetical protein KF824_01895 [Fimbriimonadaceae bacterium]
MNDLPWPSNEVFLREKQGPVVMGNPHPVDSEWCRFVIQNKILPHEARRHYDIPEPDNFEHDPIWTNFRIGQTQTTIPDTIRWWNSPQEIYIGGQYGEWSSPDLKGYNDVFHINKEGELQHFAYLPSDFPPVSFHTATFVGDGFKGSPDGIMIIGGTDWEADSIVGTTRIHYLDLGSFSIEQVEVNGQEPGSLSHHQSIYVDNLNAILILEQSHRDKGYTQRSGDAFLWLLELDPLKWRKVELKDVQK